MPISGSYFYPQVHKPQARVSQVALVDGVTAPAIMSGTAVIYVDTADGDLKVKFSDGTIKTIVVDT